MNTSQGALYFGAGIDLNQWRRDIDSMRRDIAGLNQETQRQTANMDSAFQNLSAGIAAYFSVGALKNFVMEMVNVRGEFQKTEIAFTTMLGNAGKASALMDQMVQLAAKTPFSLQDVSAGAKQLLAFQVPADQVVDTLTRMGNIAAGLSIPLSRINLVYGQVRAKGKLMGDDLRQFTEAGIPMVAELAKKFNKTTAEVSAMVSAGKVGFKDVQEVLFAMTNEGGMFFNLMEKQSKSVTGKISNMGDAWDQALNDIGESQEGIISDSIQGLTYLIEHYQDVIKVILTLVETYGAYRAALIVTAALQGRMVAPAIIQGFGNLIKLIRGLTVAQTALNAASLANPYVLLATLIAGLIAVTFNYRQEIGELLGIIEEQTAAQKAQQAVTESYNNSFGKGVASTKASISELIAIIRNENSTLDQRKRAYERLISIDSEFRGTLDAQFRATYKLGNALEFVTGKIDAFAMAQAKAAASRKFLEESFEEQFKAGALKTQVLDLKAEEDKLKKSYSALLAKSNKSLYLTPEETRQLRLAEEKLSAIVEKRKDLAEKWREQQNIANEKGSISNAIIRNNNIEIAQKEKQLSQLEKEIKLGKLSGEVLDLKKKQAERIRYELSGFKPEVIQQEEIKTQSPGYVEQIEAKIDELKIAYQKALTPAAARSINVEIAKWQEKLDALNPKKDTKDNRQLAEILPIGSIKELQRRASLIQEAIETAVNGQVKLRKLDKFGNDKDKKGNPFLTGEIISSEEAAKRLNEINEEIRKKQIKSFDEELSETERQWKAKYQIAEFYGQKIADEQFPELKGSYYDDISKRFEQLNNKRNEGVSLSNSEISQWQKLKDILSSLTGEKDSLSNFNDSMDKALQKLPSLYDQIEYLQNLRDSQDNKGTSLGFFAAADSKLQEKIQEQRNIYQEFLNEQRTFEDKKIEIEQKYNNIRKQIGLNKNLSDQDRLRQLDAAGKEEAKAYQKAFMSVFEKTDIFEKAFGNINALTKKEIDELIPQLEEKLQELSNMGMPNSELENFRKKIEDLKSLSSGNNPIKSLIKSFKELRKRIREGTATQEDFSRLNEQLQRTKYYTDLAINSAKELAEALGIDGKGGPFEKFAKDLTQTIEGLVNALVGYFSVNIQQMVSGIAQMVVGVVKMLSTAGDGKKEKSIRSWKIAVDELKSSYEELQRVIEKTAGEAQLSMQRDLISNLKEQQRILLQMRAKEAQKKKADEEKIASYSQQIQDINVQIQDLIDNFQNSITTTDFKELSEKIADALIDAFGKGEDAASAFEKVVDDVMRNAVANALRIKILEPAVKQMVDSLYKSMGFGGQSGATTEQAALLKNYQDQVNEINNKLKSASSEQAFSLNQIKNGLLEKIKILQQQISANAISGSFDGLTQDERDQIKSLGVDAMNQYTAALQQYEDLFGAAAGNAQGLKGDIKGITEKTAGALEAQFNAMRINLAAMLQYAKQNHVVQNAHTVLLSQIEVNTRRLHNMDKTLTEMNAKMKKSLAGVP